MQKFNEWLKEKNENINYEDEKYLEAMKKALKSGWKVIQVENFKKAIIAPNSHYSNDPDLYHEIETPRESEYRGTIYKIPKSILDINFI